MKNYFCVIVWLTLILTTKIIADDSDKFPVGISLENSGIQLKTLNADDLNNIKIVKINKNKIEDYIHNSNKKISIIAVWGSWCPTTLLGLTETSKFSKFKDYINIYLISVDICSQQQVDYIKKIIKTYNIDFTTYIVENNFYNKIKDFVKLTHVYDFIKSFDDQYKQISITDPNNNEILLSPLPYFSIINNNGNILYRKIPVIPENPSNMIPKDFFVLDENEIKQIINENINK
jgi:thiol-disulfide isomerase/thioredoxin